jgi:hypothetical protein
LVYKNIAKFKQSFNSDIFYYRMRFWLIFVSGLSFKIY